MEKIYSEVNEILNLLGSFYINMLPKDLYDLITNSKDKNYKVKFNSLENISTDNCSKEAIDMIALFHLNYWCTSEQEKENLNELLNNNYTQNEEAKKEKYNYNNLFNSESKSELQIEDLTIQNNLSFFQKIINKLKNFLHIKF